MATVSESWTSGRDGWVRHHGTRARIGLIVPPTNTTNEAEFAAHLPEGVTVHSHRTPLHIDSADPDFERALFDDVAAAAAMLAPLGPSVVAYACTVATMMTDEARLAAHLTATSGAPGMTTAGAVLDALRALGGRRVAIATPYTEALTAHEADYLGAAGFTVTAALGLGLGRTRDEFRFICRTPADTVRRLAAETLAQGPADTLFLSCTDLPTFDLIDALEREHDVAVVTSNQATLWKALTLAGVGGAWADLGRLFRHHGAAG